MHRKEKPRCSFEMDPENAGYLFLEKRDTLLHRVILDPQDWGASLIVATIGASYHGSCH